MPDLEVALSMKVALDVEFLIKELNNGRAAPSIGIDRVFRLPGPGIRLQVGLALFPKKAVLFDAVEQAINLASDWGLATVGIERQTRDRFILILEARS